MNSKRTFFDYTPFEAGFVGLLFITLLGFFLRYMFFMKTSLWGDEGQNIILSGADSIFQLNKIYRNINSTDHPLGFPILLFYWNKLYGWTPESMRSFSLVASTLSIVTTYFGIFIATREIKTALLGALMMALSTLSIRYSYDVTEYALVGAIAPISMGLFLRDLLKKEPTHSMELLVVNSLLLNLHYFCYFFVFSQVVIFLASFLYNKKIKILSIVVPCLGYLIATIPFVALFSPVAARKFQGYIENSPSSYKIILDLFMYDRSLQIPMVIVFALLLIFWLKNNKRKKTVITPISLIFLTITTVLVVQFFLWHFFGSVRYLIFLYPFVVFIFAYLIFDMSSKIRYYFCAIVILMMTYSTFTYKAETIQDFDSATNWIKKEIDNQSLSQPQVENGIIVPFGPRWISEYYVDYKNIRAHWHKISADEIFENKILNQFSNDLKIDNIQYIYFVLYLDGDLRSEEIKNQLRTKFTFCDEMSAVRIKILKFKV